MVMNDAAIEEWRFMKMMFSILALVMLFLHQLLNHQKMERANAVLPIMRTTFFEDAL